MFIELIFMHSEQSGDSGYFEALKHRPADYIHTASPQLIDYLRMLKANRTTFLLTGSHIDFANLTATQSLGPDWRSLFDVVVCFAKKPGFFSLNRPFLRTNGSLEADAIPAHDMRLNEVYCQGNWTDLLAVLRSKRCGAERPKVLYVGDNLVQDVYSPFALSGCDTIAVIEELAAESVAADEDRETGRLLRSKAWGSYFGSAADPMLWSSVIQRNAKLCVATVDELAALPMEHEFRAFAADGPVGCGNGFWPNGPDGYDGGK